jgi:hypothetical protein
MWVRADGAFEGIVSPDLYFVARGIILERNRRLSDDEMLAKLRALAGARAVRFWKRVPLALPNRPTC